MGGSGGNFAQLGYGEETTWGTAVTANRFNEFVSEGLKQEIKRIESAGLRGRRILTSNQWVPGGKRVAGPVELELRDTGFGLLLKHMFGSVATVGAAAPYTHTFTPGDLPAGLTVQVGRPQEDGTVTPFTYSGCRIAEWTLSGSVDEIAKLALQLVGKAETTATALATPSYPAGDLLTFVGGDLTVAAAQIPVKSVELQGQNALAGERWYLQNSASIAKPVEAGLRPYSGSFVADFSGLTQYNRFVNGTEAALVLTFRDAGGTHHLKVTANVRFDGETPNVSGPEMLEQPVQFVCVASGADSTAITAEYVTTDATP